MYRSDRIIIRYFPRFRNRFFPESNFSSSYRRTFYQIFRILFESKNLFTSFLARDNLVLHRENSAGISEHDGLFFDIDLAMNHQRCVYMTQIVPVKILREAVKFFQGIETELKANDISCITVYFYTYRHLHHPITSALYTTYYRRITPIHMHSRLVFDFHDYLICLFLRTRILIFP